MVGFILSLLSTLLAIAGTLGFVAIILFVAFGQITVRKLRKNSETTRELGIELLSGWDIINVAQALAMPSSITRKLKNTPLSAFYANADILRKHTNRFDWVLGSLFYWLFMLSGLSLALLALLDTFGVFD